MLKSHLCAKMLVPSLSNARSLIQLNSFEAMAKWRAQKLKTITSINNCNWFLFVMRNFLVSPLSYTGFVSLSWPDKQMRVPFRIELVSAMKMQTKNDTTKIIYIPMMWRMMWRFLCLNFFHNFGTWWSKSFSFLEGTQQDRYLKFKFNNFPGHYTWKSDKNIRF